MAIFGKSAQKVRESISTIGATNIANGTRIEGDMALDSNLNVDGYFKGNILSTAGIIISKNGKVEGVVQGERIIVNGLIHGDIECNSIEILNGGRVKGNILTGSLIIDSEGIFEGENKIKSSGVLEIKQV